MRGGRSRRPRKRDFRSGSRPGAMPSSSRGGCNAAPADTSATHMLADHPEAVLSSGACEVSAASSSTVTTVGWSAGWWWRSGWSWPWRWECPCTSSCASSSRWKCAGPKTIEIHRGQRVKGHGEQHQPSDRGTDAAHHRVVPSTLRRELAGAPARFAIAGRSASRAGDSVFRSVTASTDRFAKRLLLRRAPCRSFHDCYRATAATDPGAAGLAPASARRTAAATSERGLISSEAWK